MARKTEDIQLDIAEVKQLILAAKRPNNQAALAKHLSGLKSQLESASAPKVEKPAETEVKSSEAPQKVEVPISETPQKNISYTPLTKYSWDQEGCKVKIFFTLDGVGQECQANQIDVKFESQSVEMKIRGYKKGNFMFAIRKLCAPIETETCTYFVKTNSICLTLIKKDTKSWPQLQYKEQAFKQKKQDKEANPSDSIMNMMKKMYEEGDENMKRTIAQAWTKAQDKKGGDMGGMGDMGMGGLGGMGGMGGFGGMGGMGGLGGMGDFMPKKKK